MVQIKQILYFKKIAQLKSMNKAADELYITQSNLSHAMKNLEQELGVTLFERTNKGVVLTEEGVRFNQYSSNILNQLDILSHMFSQSPVETLSVSLYPTLFNGRLASEAYHTFSQSRACELTLREERLSQIIEHVAKSESELGLIQYNQRQTQDISRVLKQYHLEYTELDLGTWLAVVDQNHPLAKRESVRAFELLSYPLVRSRDDYYSQLTAYMEIDGIPLQEFNRLLFAGDGITKLSLLKHADAFMFLSSWNKSAAQEMGLSAIPIVNCGIEMHLGWIKRRQEQLTPHAQDFLSFVMKFIQN